jgi:putative membrane protein
MNFLLRLLIAAAVAYGLTFIMNGVDMNDYWSAFWFSCILALVNVFVRPLLILFTIPLTLLTFGLFLLVINALMVLLVDYMMDSVHFDNFWGALLFSVLLSVITPAVQRLIIKEEKEN